MYLIDAKKARISTESLISAKAIAKYIARYASHPAISERRILKWDRENKTVTWFYNPHEDDLLEEKGPVKITESVYDFMKRLIIHIPENDFKQIRYYGFYANKFKNKESLFNKLFSTKEIENLILKIKMEARIIIRFWL